MNTQPKNIRAYLIGDETSEENMNEEAIELISDSNKKGSSGYTIVELVTRKRVRFYHEDSFNKTPKITIREHPNRKNQKLISYKGFMKRDDMNDEIIDNGCSFYGPEGLCDDGEELIEETVKDQVSKGEFVKKRKYSHDYIVQPIVVIPKEKIRKTTYEEHEFQEFEDYLYDPVILEDAYKISKKHPEGCKCKKCD